MSKKKMSTREKIDTSHEVRQWVGLGLTGTMLFTALNPEGAKKVAGNIKSGCIKAKNKVVETYNDLKKKF